MNTKNCTHIGTTFLWNCRTEPQSFFSPGLLGKSSPSCKDSCTLAHHDGWRCTLGRRTNTRCGTTNSLSAVSSHSTKAADGAPALRSDSGARKMQTASPQRNGRKNPLIVWLVMHIYQDEEKGRDRLLLKRATGKIRPSWTCQTWTRGTKTLP
jgi:hypothetical protein